MKYTSRDMGRAVSIRRWTPSAIECLQRGCNCEGCFYEEFFKRSGTLTKCQMKAAVLELKRTIGNPYGYEEKTITDDTKIKEKEQIMTKTLENPQEKQIEEKSKTPQQALAGLTYQEIEVCKLLCEGLEYVDIAKQLVVSQTTVKTHMNNIFQKLMIENRTKAVLKLLELGICTIETPEKEEQYILSEAKSTTDYSLFNFSKSNRRNLNEYHIQKLCMSIMKNGYMAAFPIIVSPEMTVIDGQHRFNACKRLKLPIIYIIENKKIQDILPAINNSQLRWTIKDWINYHAQNGNENYKKFQFFIEKYCLSSTNGAIILFKGKTSGSQSKLFTDGNLQFTDENFSECGQVAENVKKITRILKIDSGKLIAAIVFLIFHNAFDIKQLLKKLEYQARTFQKTTNTREYLKQLQEVYNYKSKIESVDFLYDYDKMLAKK